MDGSIATIGISDHAQRELGNITFIELPEEGMNLSAGDEVAYIESVKASSPVFSSVSGVVTEVNTKLEDSPEGINYDPYDFGWIFRVKMNKPEELKLLMNAEEYGIFLNETKEK